MLGILARVDPFSHLAASVREQLACAFERRTVSGGELVANAGDRADSLFVVVDGRLQVFERDRGSGETEIAWIGPGEVFGELALLGDRPHAACVRALRDSTLLRLPASVFLEAVRDSPEAILRFSRVMVDRAMSRPGAAPAARRVRTVAVVRAGTRPLDVGVFCRALTAALLELGAAERISSSTIDAALGPGSAQVPRGHAREAGLIARLHDLERPRRVIVYEADDGPSEWTRRCLRQADHVLLVADASGEPQPGEVEADLLSRPDIRATRELVLLHREGVARTPAGPWLAVRSVRAHRHVGQGRVADYQSLARGLLGRAQALVLGGGGARGLAHLGVMRALEEARVPVDAVGGTSIGAIMGAGWAMGWAAEEREARAIAAFVRTRFLLGLTFPLVSLSSSRKLTGLLRRDFGDAQIEDLPVPYFCVSANLQTGETTVHDDGPLWLATRASASLPGVLPPVHSERGLLVDGGVVNDLPVDIMRGRMDGTVVAVDLQPADDPRVYEPFGPALSGWHVLWRRLNPFATALGLPNGIQITLRAKDIAARRSQAASLSSAAADLVLRPPTGGTNPLDFRAARGLIELGYRYAMERLETPALTRTLVLHQILTS